MQISLTVYYTDGTSGICTFEKPPGAHPESTGCAIEGLVVAETQTGKIVERIGTSRVNPFSKAPNSLVIDDNLITREALIKRCQMMSTEIFKKDRYKHLAT